MRQADELRTLFESYVDDLALMPELGGLEESLRYTLGSGGKRIRPVLCLATAESVGCDAEIALPAAAAVELVHTFSLVHDDLPALDDDDVRRGRPSAHVQFGEAVAILAGDALLAEAFRLALSYESTAAARRLARATLGMIGGQYLDICGSDDLTAMHRLKTGCMFEAAIGCGLDVAGAEESESWRSLARELGLLFQIVDDILDGDGCVLLHGVDGARDLADEAAARAHGHLSELDADSRVLVALVSGLVARTA